MIIGKLLLILTYPTQHQYMQVETTPSSNADKVVGMTTVVYSEVDKDKLVPVVQLPGTSVYTMNPL